MAVENSSAWQELLKYKEAGAAQKHLMELFEDGSRSERFSIELEELFLDYSKNRITDKTVELLLDLADQQKLPEWIDKLLSGGVVNGTEDRAAKIGRASCRERV